jgi:hypothetical protein
MVIEARITICQEVRCLVEKQPYLAGRNSKQILVAKKTKTAESMSKVILLI